MMSDIIASYIDFLDLVYKKLTPYGIDLKKLQLDHLAFQVPDKKNFARYEQEFASIAQKVREEVVGSWFVGIFKLDSGLKYCDQIINALELIVPLEGHDSFCGWEHIEFVIPSGFEEFIAQYPELEWNTKSINHPMFPKIKLELGAHLQVKFQLQGILSQ